MTRQQMTEPEAFRWIQRTAMDRRTTMKAVAEAVVEGLGDAARLTASRSLITSHGASPSSRSLGRDFITLGDNADCGPVKRRGAW